MSKLKMEWEEYLSLIASKKEEDLRKATMMAVAGMTGFRVGDWVRLKWSDVWDVTSGKPKEVILLSEQKTGKRRKVYVSDRLADAISSWRESSNPVREDAYIFRRLRGGNTHEHINPDGVRKILGTKTHEFRRTFAWYMYNKGGANHTALCMVNKMLNHASISTTVIYLGIEDDDIKSLYLCQ